MPSERYLFEIPIGDWSGDGHGKCTWYMASATKPIEAVREAYFKASKVLPEDVHPEVICCGYGDVKPDDAEVKALQDAGAPAIEEYNTESMAVFVAWFINTGDPSLDVKIEKDVRRAMRPFAGVDAKRRHIGFIGYGLHGED